MKKLDFWKISVASLIVLTLFIFFYSFEVSAADPSVGGLVPCGFSGGNPCTLCHFFIGFHKLVLYGMYLVMALALLALVIAGITYVVSAGNESLVNQAKGFLKGTLIGFAVVLGGYMIITAMLWVISARGDLGVGQTSWSSFTCNTASSSLTSLPPTNTTAPAASSGTAITPGSPGGACGENLLGTCTPIAGSGFGFDTCGSQGKTFLQTGQGCGTGYWCCAAKISPGGTCTSHDGAQGTCQQVYGRGGIGDLRQDVCVNTQTNIRSIMIQPDATRMPVCNETVGGQKYGCCDPNGIMAYGIIDAPCGPIADNATCRPGTFTQPCPGGGAWITASGPSPRIACDTGLYCCGT